MGHGLLSAFCIVTKQGIQMAVDNTDKSVILDMDTMAALAERYQSLMGMQTFDPALLDYGILEGHRPHLMRMAELSNSAISVFDMYRGEHAFASYNFERLLGYESVGMAAEGNAYFDARVHPDDFAPLLGMGIQMLEFSYGAPKEERGDYKMVNEYRVRGRDDRYLRIIEQHQLLESDPVGNLWLSMSIIDVSPRQESELGVVGTILNFRTGQSVALENLVPSSTRSEVATLSAREREILGLIQQGHLSKEISAMLSISVHTVNTHRQRILQKLVVDNSMEAVQLAQRLGFLQ
jgi:DNA-binding CsgD family transcriptional regulator/PAS domain-containing protein